jgi:hypothetical protein
MNRNHPIFFTQMNSDISFTYAHTYSLPLNHYYCLAHLPCGHHTIVMTISIDDSPHRWDKKNIMYAFMYKKVLATRVVCCLCDEEERREGAYINSSWVSEGFELEFTADGTLVPLRASMQCLSAFGFGPSDGRVEHGPFNESPPHEDISDP